MLRRLSGGNADAAGFWLHFVIGFATGVVVMTVAAIALIGWLGKKAEALAMIGERRGVERDVTYVPAKGGLDFLVIAVVLAGLAGCSHAVLMQDPKSGQIAQCDHGASAWGEWGEIIANDRCAADYERAGWQRLN